MSKKSKEGGKNKKIGRHSRNPSSKLQAQRSNRNKDKRIARAPKGSVGHFCPKKPSVGPENIIPIPMNTHQAKVVAPCYEVSLDGKVLDWVQYYEQARASYVRTYHERVKVYRINELGHRRELDMKAASQQLKRAA